MKRLTALLTMLCLLTALPALAEEPALPLDRVLAVLNDVHALHAHGQALISASTDPTWYASYAAEVEGRLTGETVPAPTAVYLLEGGEYATDTAFNILTAEEAGIVSMSFSATVMFASDAPQSDALLLYAAQDMPYLVSYSCNGEVAMCQAWVAPVELLEDAVDADALLANLAPCGVTGVTPLAWPEHVTPAPREVSTGTQMPDMNRIRALIARMDADCSQRLPEPFGFTSSLWVDENGQVHFGSKQTEINMDEWRALFDRGEPRMVLHNGPVADWAQLRSFFDGAPGVDWYIVQEANAYAAIAISSMHVYKDGSSFQPPYDQFAEFYADDSVSPFGFVLLLYDGAFPVVVRWQAENGAVALTGVYASHAQYEDCQTALDVHRVLVEYTQGAIDYDLRVVGDGAEY